MVESTVSEKVQIYVIFQKFPQFKVSAFHSYMSRDELLKEPLVIAQGCYQENSFILFTVNPIQPILPWSTCGHFNRFYTVYKT